MLGDRIEVNFSNGKTVNVWIKPDPKPEVREHKKESELKEIAEGISQEVVIRTYETAAVETHGARQRQKKKPLFTV